jgi:hypothetical protein
METDWATEHLQTIRTLMERSAIYRRALAPVMVWSGIVGCAAAISGWLTKIESPRSFAIYWLSVGVIAMGGVFLLVRRQALKEREAFWSPPARRITQALLPALTAGFIVTVTALIETGQIDLVRLPAGWIILYGCALHAAGFFTPRGLKLFGWLFVLGGCGLFALGAPEALRPVSLYAHGAMGLFFGGLHLAYGVYLYFTEQGKNAA